MQVTKTITVIDVEFSAEDDALMSFTSESDTTTDPSVSRVTCRNQDAEDALGKELVKFTNKGTYLLANT